MATLTAKLTLTSSDWHTDSLNLTATQTLIISGDEQVLGRFTTSTTATKLPVGSFDSTNKKAWIYMKNTSSTTDQHIRVYEDNGAAVSHKFANLGAGEWAFFPYTDNDLIWVDSATAAPVLEYGIFEV
mgnify:FL=1